MVQLYYGDGKGKTTAAVGAAVRAAGAGASVLFVSFYKDGSSCEVAALEQLVTQAGGIIAGRMAILAEGDAQERDDLIYLQKLPVFNADGSIKE